MEPYSFRLFSLLLLICTQALLHLKDWVSKKRKLPPGPTGLPIVGNLLTLGHRPHESLTKLAKTYGSLMTVRLGFKWRPIPDAVTAQTNHELSVAWLPGNAKWRGLRKIYNSPRHQMMDGMVRRVVDASEAGEAIRIGRLVFGTTLNLLSNTMFSVDVLIWRIMELAGKPNLSDYFPLLKPFDVQGIKRTTKVSYDRLHVLLDEIIDQLLKRRASGLPRCEDFVDVLLDQSNEQSHEEFNGEDINILLTKKKLSIEEKDIPRLPYLQALLIETMRLHPTTPLLLPHRAEMDVEVCGYTIPKHTQVFVNAWAIIARDPMFMGMGNEVDFRGTNFSFIPFGSGRRICPSLTLAIRMLSLLLASHSPI
ncbi:hypothetical protein ACJW30_11G153400 [Castanea mollissima]